MAIVLDGTSGITTPALDSTARFATADMPLGSVIQVVSATTSTMVNTTTTTFVDTTLTAAITPTSATSKILVFVNQNGVSKTPTNSQSAGALRLLRDSTTLIKFGGANGYTATEIYNQTTAGASYIDSPNTTSSVTYKTQFANIVNASLITVQADAAVSTITLMEIAA